MITAASLLLLGLGVATTAPPPQAAAALESPDLQGLYLAARERLRQGDLEQARVAAAQAEGLLRSDPAWDPDGLFRHSLLPALRVRLERLEAAARGLEELAAAAGERLAKPRPPDGATGLAAYETWAGALAGELRDEREGYLLEALPDPADRDAVRLTPSFNRNERVIEAGSLRALITALEANLSGLPEVDGRVQALKGRLEAARRESQEALRERQRLEQEMSVVEARQRIYLAALADSLGEGIVRALPTDRMHPQEVGRVFSDLLRRRRLLIQTETGQTIREQRLRLEEIRRYRHINAVQSQAGLSPDLNGEIDALEAAVKALPVTDPAVKSASAGWLECCFSSCR